MSIPICWMIWNPETEVFTCWWKIPYPTFPGDPFASVEAP